MGQRLKKISKDIPKPMVKIHNKPLLEHQINECVKYGFKKIIILVSYKKDIIKNYFSDGRNFGASIDYVEEKKQLGTAGALINSLSLLSDEFLLIYGDIFFKLDLLNFYNFHKKKRSDVSIMLQPNDHPFDSDLIELEKNNRISNIILCPHNNILKKNLTNAAVYFFKKKSFLNIKLNNNKPDIVKHLFPKMIKLNKKLFGYITTEYMKDIGTPDRIKKVIRDIDSGKVQKLKRNLKKKVIIIDKDLLIKYSTTKNKNELELVEGVANQIYKINLTGHLCIIYDIQMNCVNEKKNDLNKNITQLKIETLFGNSYAYFDRYYYLKLKKNHTNYNENLLKFFKKIVLDFNVAYKKSWIFSSNSLILSSSKDFGFNALKVGKIIKNDKSFYVCRNINSGLNRVLKEIRK